MEKNIKSGSWYCLLYKRDISEGLCIDINLERVKCFKADALCSVMKQLKINKYEVDRICESCPNMPLSGEEVIE